MKLQFDPHGIIPRCERLIKHASARRKRLLQDLVSAAVASACSAMQNADGLFPQPKGFWEGLCKQELADGGLQACLQMSQTFSNKVLQVYCAPARCKQLSFHLPVCQSDGAVQENQATDIEFDPFSKLTFITFQRNTMIRLAATSSDMLAGIVPASFQSRSNHQIYCI